MMFPVVPAGIEPESLPAFIVGSNGIFLRKQSALGVSQAKVDNIAHLPKVEPTIEYDLPRIPAAVSARIAGFLRDVYRKNKSEGLVLLCLDEQGAWQPIIPRQEIGNGHAVAYFIEPGTVPDGWRLMGTVHSHPSEFSHLAPSASSIDENDERKFDGLHLVAGSLGREPKYGAAVVVDGTRWRFTDSSVVIEPAEPVDAPPEWIMRVKVLPPKVLPPKPSSTGGYGFFNKKWHYPKADESLDDCFRRVNKWRLDDMVKHAARIGVKFDYTITPIEEEHGEQTEWIEAVTFRCTGKHVGKPCPDNCGCHCDACKRKLVGSFGVVCGCEECFLGCDEPVSPGETCAECKEGHHYEDKGKEVVNT